LTLHSLDPPRPADVLTGALAADEAERQLADQDE
jgi:hypothetical protein